MGKAAVAPLTEELLQCGELRSLVRRGCDVKQADDRIASVSLAVLGELGKQLFIVSRGGAGEREEGWKRPKAGAWRDDASARGRRLPTVAAVHECHAHAAARESIGGASANNAAADHNDIGT